MYCPHCGKETKDNVRFCPYCGQKITPKKGNEYRDNLQNTKSEYSDSKKNHETVYEGNQQNDEAGYRSNQQHYYDSNYNKRDTGYPENENPDSYGGGGKKNRILFLILTMAAVLIVVFVLFRLLPKPNPEPAPHTGETADTAVAGQDISDSAATAETVHGISDTAATADTAAIAATTNTVTLISHTYNTYVNNTYVQCAFNTPFTAYANVKNYLTVWDTSDRGAEIRRVQPNAELRVLGQTNELYYVEIISDGGYGWVNSIYTRTSPSDTDKTVNNTDVQIKYEKPVTIQATGNEPVTVWDDPDQDKSETSIDPDTELKAYGETDNSYYAEVVSTGEYGWINMEDVRTVISPYNENDLPPASVGGDAPENSGASFVSVEYDIQIDDYSLSETTTSGYTATYQKYIDRLVVTDEDYPYADGVNQIFAADILDEGDWGSPEDLLANADSDAEMLQDDVTYKNYLEFGSIYNQKGFLSYRLDGYWYTGGEGIGSFKAHTIDLHTGNELTLPKLLNKSKEETASIVRQAVLDEYSDDIYDTDTLDTVLDDIENQSYCIDTDGRIVVLFGEYAIGEKALQVEIGYSISINGEVVSNDTQASNTNSETSKNAETNEWNLLFLNCKERG